MAFQAGVATWPTVGTMKAGRSPDFLIRPPVRRCSRAEDTTTPVHCEAPASTATAVLSASAETAQSITIWDPVVRLTHWGLVLAVLTNTFIADIGSRTHRWAGYLTGVLVVVRLVWGFIGSKHARLADFIPPLRQVRRHLDAFATETPSVHDGHNPLGALMVFALLGLLALLCLTGLLG